jgi:glycerol-3-phosphate acyltransferase PlsY
VAYLLGSIPFGYLIVRLRFGADIRETGSGGTGATNVSRKAGKGAGLLTLALDAIKGAAAILITRAIVGSGAEIQWYVALAAVAVLLGHIFPIWLRFRGGKGVATGVGVFLLLAPWALGIAGLVFLVTVGLTRYVSLGSVLAAASLAVVIFLRTVVVEGTNPGAILFAAVTGALLIIFAHRENISRLMTGTEAKFR